MAEQIKRKVPIQWVQTIKDDGTYEFTPDPNVYSTEKNVPSTNVITLQSTVIDGIDTTNRFLYNSAGTAVLSWESLNLTDQYGVGSVDWGGRVLVSTGGNRVLNWQNDLNLISPVYYTSEIVNITQNLFSATSSYAGKTIQGSSSAALYDVVAYDKDTFTWNPVATKSTQATYVLGIWLPGNLVLLEGELVVHDDYGTFGPYIAGHIGGAPIYLQSDGVGVMDCTPPTVSPNIVRVLGYTYYKNTTSGGDWIMKFSPQDYVSSPTIPASASYATSASYALTAQTLLGSVTSASYATSASFALTASFVRTAQTASYVQNAISSSFATTASYVQNAQTASFVQNAQTASYVLNAVSSSFASTASFVQTASYVETSQTASYVLNAVSSSFASTASFVQTASYVLNAQTASYVLNAISSSFALTASYVQNAQTASYVQNAQTASFVQNSISSSFASTASYVQNAQTASYVQNAQTASFVQNAQTASYVLNAISSSFATTASFVVSASYAQTASYVNTLNQTVLITGSLTVGATSAGASENTLTLGARDAANEGGQIGFNAPGGTYTSASFIDNWQNKARILKGNNTTSTGLIAQWDIHTTQMQLAGYTAASSFPGTATANLAVDSGGNVITVSTTGGTVFPYVGNAVITGSLTTTGIIYAQPNGGMYFQGGDDAALYDINVSNHMGIYGVQDSTIASIKLGSGGGIISGKSNNIGIGTINPTSASFQVNGNVWANSFTGSLLGTASYASQALSSSYALSASYALNATTSSYALNTLSSSYAQTASFVQNTIFNPRLVGFSVANGTTITGPGSTSPRISTEITIPAGTLATNSIIEMIWMSIRLSGAGGTIQSAVYLSTSSGTLGSSPTVGSTLLATGANMISTNVIVKNVRDLNKQSTSGTVANAATQYGSDFGLQTVVTSFTINNSSTLYLQFCVSSTGPADTSCIRNVRITEYKAV